MAHILFLEWNSFCNEYMKRAWERAGDTVVSFPFSTKEDTRFNAELTKQIVMTLMSEKFDYLFSFNYFPVAAMAAKACRIRYVSWIYDSPYAQLYSETVHYPTNDIRVFDSHEVQKLQELGVESVSYLPLAADTDYYDTFAKKDGKQYASEVSFVGALYTDKRQQLYERFEALPSYEKGYLDGIVEMQSQLYGSNLLEDMLTEPLIEKMQKAAPLQPHPDAFATPAWYYANFYLGRRVTSLERTRLLTALSEKVEVKVYTRDDIPSLRKCICKPVDYYTQAPFVYKNSKINLNITLKSIQTGIPLRVFDIMGCGGFLLTNYQEDMLSFFTPDEDFVYYTDEKDMLEKVSYYLSHDAEREKIAKKGYEKVKQFHTFDCRLQSL